MLVVPDDRLTEVEVMLLQEGWIVGAIRIAAPDVERTTGFENSAEVTERCIEQDIELIAGHKVVGQRTVFSA